VQKEEAPISQIGQFRGDPPAVPETGSTFAPLFLSLAALWGELDSAPFSQPNELKLSRAGLARVRDFLNRRLVAS